jgi:PAS domain S-box-containing protein
MLELNKGDIKDMEKLTEPIPMVVVGVHNKEFGCIKKINLLFSSLFGYTKDDILDKNISTIMPELYSSFHETFIY